MNVYLRRTDGTLGNPVWSRKGNQGDRWFKAQIDVPTATYYQQLTFEGIVGKGDFGDQAIDDTSFTYSKKCPTRNLFIQNFILIFEWKYFSI